MSINSDTDINLALLQLGKNANRYRLDKNVVPHKIIEWDSANSDSQPTDDELNTAYTAWKAAWDLENDSYKSKRRAAYDSVVNQLDMLYKDIVAGKLDTTGTWATHIKNVKDSNPKP
jgi:hypothetical protein